MKEILTLSGTQQARMIRQGEVSSVELIDAHVARIEQVNPQLNAVVELLAEQARQEAKRVDQRRAQGVDLRPLEGVPFSIKDSIEVAGTVCTAGTLGFRNAPPSEHDATLVAYLRDLGAIPLARTNLPDLLFAFESDNLINGRTNNPYDVTRTSGGSSGGEAALIAACGSPLGLGSDAAGSVRLPAGYCGIASIKPTSGRLPRTGHVPGAGGWIETLWQIGPMARRVEDLCTLMSFLTKPDQKDRTVVPMPCLNSRDVRLSDLRVAFFSDNGIVPAHPEIAEGVRAAAKALAAAGVRFVEERRPPGIEQSFELEMQLIGPDGGDGLRTFLANIGSSQTHFLLDGWLDKLEHYRTTVAGFGAYWAALDQFRQRMFSFLQEFDVLLSPVAAHAALPHGTSIEHQNFLGFSYTMTHNLTGWPAAVVRVSETEGRLPIGVQVAAAPWREDRVLAVIHRLEQEFGGWRPPRIETIA